MSDTVSDRADKNDRTEGTVPVQVEICVTFNPGSEAQQRAFLRAEDLERALWLRSNGLTWTEALVSIAVEQ